MENFEYDVVIVGSGISGSVIAKTLTNAGKKVLMLEAGLHAGMALGGEDAYNTHYGYLQTFHKTLAKGPNAPYTKIKNAQSIDVLDVLERNDPSKGYIVQKGPSPFLSDSLRGAGGTTLHWLGTTLRMLPNDFKTKTFYGRGVDWPLSYHDLKRYYEMAENEIGVSGNVEEQKLPNMGIDFFSKGYVYPMQKIPQSYLDKKFMEKTESLKISLNNKEYRLTCISTPQGRNSIPNRNYTIAGVSWDAIDQKLKCAELRQEDNYDTAGALWDGYTGQRCEGNASCTPICPVQAKYNALKTLKRAKQKNLSIITQAVASYLIVMEEGGNSIAGIRYKRYKNEDSPDYTTHMAKGKVYVLAANAIENAKLLLASNAANSSDQVGRNLMDHLCLLTWGLFPEKIFPFRGPGSTTNIPTFRDGEFRKEHAPWIVPIDNWGWGWPVFSPGTDTNAAIAAGKFGKELREHLNESVTRQVLLHFECEQEPDPENRVTIDPRYMDRIDNYRPVIQYRISDYMRMAFESAKKVSDQIFAANGIKDFTSYEEWEAGYVEYKGQGYTFRGAGHIVGTHRMGDDKKRSVVNSDLRTWDHDNLYLVGAGNMPTLGTSNPTLTLTALSFKAAEAILRQLEK